MVDPMYVVKLSSAGANPNLGWYPWTCINQTRFGALDRASDFGNGNANNNLEEPRAQRANRHQANTNRGQSMIETEPNLQTHSDERLGKPRMEKTLGSYSRRENRRNLEYSMGGEPPYALR